MDERIYIAGDAERWTERLLADGYCVIPEALPPGAIRALDDDLADDFERTPFCQGGFYGATTKRLGRVLVRSHRAAALVQHRLILDVVGHVLSPWCESVQLNVAQAIAIHPGAPPQLPHRDQDMWRGPVGAGAEYLVNVTCLRHASTPLAASGLDMRIDHPAAYGGSRTKRSSHAPAPRYGARADYTAKADKQAYLCRGAGVRLWSTGRQRTRRRRASAILDLMPL